MNDQYHRLDKSVEVYDKMKNKIYFKERNCYGMDKSVFEWNAQKGVSWMKGRERMCRRWMHRVTD